MLCDFHIKLIYHINHISNRLSWQTALTSSLASKLASFHARWLFGSSIGRVERQYLPVCVCVCVCNGNGCHMKLH